MTPEERKAFKERMKQLKAYRENNPGKGYWDFKDDRTDHPVERPVYYEPMERTIGPADRVDAPDGTKYSELTNEQKLQLMQSDALNNDKSLESVHPEFDLVLGARMLFNAPTKIDKLLRELNNTPTKEALTKQSNTKLFKDLTTFGKDDSRYVHTQLDKANSVFSGTKKGAYIKDNKLYPGESRIYDQEPYIWWNKNKAYSELGADEDGFTATIIKDTDADDLTQVRKMTKPVGQWNGKSGFVQKSEYVTQKPVSLKDAEQFRYNGLTKTYESVKYYVGGGETGDDEPTIGTTQYDIYGNATHYLPVSLSNDTLSISLPDIPITVKDNLNLAAAVQAGQDQLAGIGKEVFANLTPYGDLESAVQAYNAAKNKDWLGLSLAGLGMLPLVPNVARYVKHGKLKPYATPTVNKNANQELINAQLRLLQDTAEKRVKASNEQYKVIERMMDDPAYLRRAEEVQAQFGDNYPTAYADAFISYNVDPTSLPQVSMMDNYSSFGNMERLDDGSFLYHKSRLIDQPFNAEHEVGHYIDMLKAHSGNVDVDNKMFKEMDKDLKHEVDRYDRYYMQPTEQKSHMNQLREWMFQNGMLETRDQKVNVNDLKKALKAVKDIPGMEGVVRASEQFGDMKLYRKWFNTIPLVSISPAMMNGFTRDNKEFT